MTTSTPMPALFIGHGSPLNAITDNVYATRWTELGASLPRPRAVVCVSAHWFTQGTGVTAMEKPPTIHDFHGFPQELQEKEYPCPGDPELAARVAGLLRPLEVIQTQEWGLDHGAWSVLARMYPEADIPVIQLSIDGTMPPQFHYEAGRRLASLRDEGILVLGSGNVCHALRDPGGELGKGGIYTWAAAFHSKLVDCITQHDHEAIFDYESWQGGKQAAPTPDHFLPLLYVLGLVRDDEPVTFPIEGLERHGGISMLAVQAG